LGFVARERWNTAATRRAFFSARISLMVLGPSTPINLAAANAMIVAQ
jgi:hypothetical protein